MPLTDVFTFYRGDTEQIEFTVREGGVEKDLTGITPHFVGKQSFSAGETEYLFDVECTVLGAGSCRAVLDADDLRETCERGVCELVLVKDADGTEQTYGQWGLVILPDVYRG